ncbi:hypothetical protein B0O99DRAFT_153515 [Bisporella sp. PMI_857]|nr:hypothetical protein B0O99DRAFT_153515 [Bisporella sp. PMI_857]
MFLTQYFFFKKKSWRDVETLSVQGIFRDKPIAGMLDMMAVIRALASDYGLDTIPASAVAIFFHVLSVVYLTTIVGRTIYRSYLTLPPSSSTRHQDLIRKKHVHQFSYLALLSIAVASFNSYRFGIPSYRIWASERVVDLPGRFEILNLSREVNSDLAQLSVVENTQEGCI